MISRDLDGETEMQVLGGDKRGQRRKKSKWRILNKNSGENRSPKGNMWSAIPVALLCMIVNWIESKQDSGPEGDKDL